MSSTTQTLSRITPSVDSRRARSSSRFDSVAVKELLGPRRVAALASIVTACVVLMGRTALATLQESARTAAATRRLSESPVSSPGAVAAFAGVVLVAALLAGLVAVRRDTD